MKGYFGGHVDVYYPQSLPNEKVYHYDVNSLYPYAMPNNPMAIGNPVYFEGDIRKIDPKAFGFFNVKIIAPDNIEVPILLTKIDSKSTIRSFLTYWNLGRYLLFSGGRNYIMQRNMGINLRLRMVIYLRKDLICLQIL